MKPRVLRRCRIGVLCFAALVSILAVILVLAAWKDDLAIESHEGTATAQVMSAGALRSAITFTTPDGETHSPKLGVLYPTKLVAGEYIQVQYDTREPDSLVRVAGRDASVAIIPAASVALGTWAVALVVVFALRRFERLAIARVPSERGDETAESEAPAAAGEPRAG